MKQFTKKNASQALTFSEVLIMEKAYTKLSLEQIQKELKKCIEAKEKALKESEKLYYKYTEKMKALYNELHEECKCEENQTLFNNIKEAIENVNIWW